jgi:hypothetical protein
MLATGGAMRRGKVLRWDNVRNTMKIIGKKRDFYDWVSGTVGIDSSVIWYRNAFTIPIVEHANSPRHVWDLSVLELSSRTHLFRRAETLGFAIDAKTNGVFIPPDFYKSFFVKNPSIRHESENWDACAAAPDGDRKLYRVNKLSIMGTIIPYLTPYYDRNEIYHTFESICGGDSKYEGLIKRSPLLGDIGEFKWGDPGNSIIQVHKLFETPIIDLRAVPLNESNSSRASLAPPAWEHSNGVRHTFPAIVLNPSLTELGLAPLIHDHADLFQRISQFMSTINEPDIVYIQDDGVKRDKAGFDDWSFKTRAAQ